MRPRAKSIDGQERADGRPSTEPALKVCADKTSRVSCTGAGDCTSRTEPNCEKAHMMSLRVSLGSRFPWSSRTGSRNQTLFADGSDGLTANSGDQTEPTTKIVLLSMPATGAFGPSVGSRRSGNVAPTLPSGLARVDMKAAVRRTGSRHPACRCRHTALADHIVRSTVSCLEHRYRSTVHDS